MPPGKNCVFAYRKIPIISPGLIFVQKAFLLGLFLGEIIFGGVYYWKELCVSNWVGFDNKNSLKHYENNKTASTNSPWAYIQEGLLLEGFLHLRFEGHFREGLFLGGSLLSEFYGSLIHYLQKTN